MNKTTMLGIAVAAMASTPALAEGQGSTLVSGSLAPSCSITAPSAQTFNPAGAGKQDIGSVSYKCNFAGNGAAIKFWSENGGKVVMPASGANNNVAQSRNYTLYFETAPVPALGTSAPATGQNVSMQTPNAAQGGALQMELESAANVAGTYSDTIYMSIAP